MNKEESEQFWSEIDAQARQDYAKCVESVKKHRSGKCTNECCRNWLMEYWVKTYPKLRISSSGEVFFGDEKKY